MDLHIAGKTAIVCASSRGLGKACATSLAGEGVHVFINGRSEESLAECEQEIRAAGGEVTAVVADVSTAEGRQKLLDACPAPDILVNNNGGPSPVGFADSKREDWNAAIEANMMAPIELIQAVLPGMRERGFGRIVNITSAMVKSPNPIMCVSSATRTAVTALSKAVSKEVVADNVTINNLLPGAHATDRIDALDRSGAEKAGEDLEAFIAKKQAGIPAGRYGTAEDFGAACAFLCSQYAGYMVGQNVLLDGGGINATL